MNVVHILDNLGRGGAQTMLRTLVAGLSARGYRQHIICLNGTFNADVVASMRQAGASVDVVGRPRLYALVGFRHIVRELRRRQPDLVHTELPWGDLVGRTAARIAGVAPVVSTVTARYVDKPRLQLLLDRRTAPWATRVVFQSREIVEFSVANEGVRRGQVVCIPNGVEPDMVDRAQTAALLRSRHGGGAQVIIGMVARLHPQKAHGELIDAFAAAAPADARLWLIGDGPEHARLAARVRRLGIEDRVLFAGDRDNPRDWIAALDIFAHPTHFEGLPLAVLEAMAMGKPVIATRVDGLSGLIESGEHGWLVPPGDGEALAAAIRNVLENPERTAGIARAGAERVLSQFSAERVVNAYDALFTSLARPASSPAAP